MNVMDNVYYMRKIKAKVVPNIFLLKFRNPCIYI